MGKLPFHPSVTTAAEPFFVSTYRFSLDAKNRVTVPAAWRPKRLGENQPRADETDGYYLAWPHSDGCVAVYPPAKREELMARLKSVAPSDKRGQQVLRTILGLAASLSCDGQGRVILPRNLKAYAKIGTEAAFVGMGDHFQIWPSEAVPEEVPADFNLGEALAALGL